MTKLKTYEGKDGQGTDVYLWHYLPSLPLSVVVACLFGIVTLFVLFRIFRTRSWFSIAFLIGGLMEAVGFGARAVAHHYTEKLLPYSVQSVLILVAPALFAASIYMALSRLIRRLNAEGLSPVSPKWLTKLFILGDVLSFMVQSGGGSLAMNDEINPNIPKYIVLVGLLLQVVMFGLYIFVSYIFHQRLRKKEKGNLPQIKWRRHLTVLYVVGLLIMVRSIFRIVEYSMGVESYLFTHEWSTYTLDGGPMLVTIFIWAIWYPWDLGRGNVASELHEHMPLEQHSFAHPSIKTESRNNLPISTRTQY